MFIDQIQVRITYPNVFSLKIYQNSSLLKLQFVKKWRMGWMPSFIILPRQPRSTASIHSLDPQPWSSASILGLDPQPRFTTSIHNLDSQPRSTALIHNLDPQPRFTASIIGLDPRSSASILILDLVSSVLGLDHVPRFWALILGLNFGPEFPAERNNCSSCFKSNFWSVNHPKLTRGPRDLNQIYQQVLKHHTNLFETSNHIKRH